MYECNVRKMSQHHVMGTVGTGAGVYGLPGALLVVICLKMYLPFLRLSLSIVYYCMLKFHIDISLRLIATL